MVPVGAGTPRVFPVLVMMSSHSRFCRTRMIPSRMTGDLLAGIWMWELIRSLCVVQRLCHRADRCRHRREDRGAGRSRCRAGATGLQDGPRARTTAERWRQVHELLDRGVGLLDCCRRLNLGLNTVKRYTRASEPVRLHRVPQYRPTLVEPYRDYLRRRRTEEPGAPVPQLMDEIRELGYPGSANLLHRYLSQGEPMGPRSSVVSPRDPVCRFHPAPPPYTLQLTSTQPPPKVRRSQVFCVGDRSVIRSAASNSQAGYPRPTSGWSRESGSRGTWTQAGRSPTRTRQGRPDLGNAFQDAAPAADTARLRNLTDCERAFGDLRPLMPGPGRRLPGPKSLVPSVQNGQLQRNWSSCTAMG